MPGGRLTWGHVKHGSGKSIFIGVESFSVLIR